MSVFNYLFPQHLQESYNSVRSKLQKDGHHIDEIDDLLTRFKALRDKRKIKGQESDISRFAKLDFGDLENFVEEREGRLSRGEVSAIIRDGEIKILEDSEEWLVLMPLTIRAAQKYGSNTRWCTAGRKGNRLLDYILTGKAVVYFVRKADGEKFAATMDDVGLWVDFWNSANDELEWDDFPYEDYESLDEEEIKKSYSLPYAVNAFADFLQGVMNTLSSKGESDVKWLDFSEGGEITRMIWERLLERGLLSSEEEQEFLRSPGVVSKKEPGLYQDYWDLVRMGR